MSGVSLEVGYPMLLEESASFHNQPSTYLVSPLTSWDKTFSLRPDPAAVLKIPEGRGGLGLPCLSGCHQGPYECVISPGGSAGPPSWAPNNCHKSMVSAT